MARHHVCRLATLRSVARRPKWPCVCGCAVLTSTPPFGISSLAGTKVPTRALRRWLAGTPLTLSQSRTGTTACVRAGCSQRCVLPFSGSSIIALPRLNPTSRVRVTSRPTPRASLNSSHLLFFPLHSPAPQSLRFIAAPSHLSLHSSSSVLHAPRCFVPGRLFSRSRLLITPLHPSLGNLRLKRRRHTGL